MVRAVALDLVLEVDAATVNQVAEASTVNQDVGCASAVLVLVSVELDASVDFLVTSVRKASAELLFSEE